MSGSLAVAVFRVLRRRFFNGNGLPTPFALRDKRNTQDDPLDEHLAGVLSAELPEVTCVKAPGPLITPDLVIYKPGLCSATARGELRSAADRICAIEVKKLERTASGAVARGSGMDYNTTPPCGTVRVYDRSLKALDVRGFYLFACLERVPATGDRVVISALVLCDGNILNADIDLYLSIVGERTKKIGLGTYGDGANRMRPMLIFANPLGAPELDRGATLILAEGEAADGEDLQILHRIVRTKANGMGKACFLAYRAKPDIAPGHVARDLVDPFPMPKRAETTQGRGRFIVGLSPK
jgi:hypothetical protein